MCVCVCGGGGLGDGGRGGGGRAAVAKLPPHLSYNISTIGFPVTTNLIYKYLTNKFLLTLKMLNSEFSMFKHVYYFWGGCQTANRLNIPFRQSVFLLLPT